MGVTVIPWKRGNKQRLYVKDSSSGQDIGWVDPNTEQGQLLLTDQATEFIAALFRYHIPREVTIRIVANSKPQDNMDLSKNVAGEAAQAKADELIQGMSKTHAEIIRSLGYASVDQTWAQGAEGERIVGSRLARLDDTWKVLHSVPIGDEGSDIDHLVIGPGGIYTLNTKAHPGSKIVCSENRVRVCGQSSSKYQPYAKKSRFEAARAARILSQASGLNVDVKGLIVYIAEEVEVMSNPKDRKVIHLSADKLVPWLRSRETSLAPSAIDLLFEKARWSRTWTA